MSVETEIGNLVAASEQLLDAVNMKKVTLTIVLDQCKDEATDATGSAAQAAASATAAAASATQAGIKATEATSAASSVGSAVTAAQAAATQAVTKAGEALNSATASEGSATGAAQSATNAAASATAAGTAKAAAETAATAAVDAKTAAATSASQAGQSASSAQGFAAAASGAASGAGAAANAAGESASAAETSASTAAAAATSATNAATAAATAAAAAGVSQTDALAAKTDAVNAATAANASRNSAAASATTASSKAEECVTSSLLAADSEAAAAQSAADAAAAVAAGGAFTGEVRMVSFLTPPAGWGVCDGTQVSKTTYPELFAVIGYQFGGTGDMFSLPILHTRPAVGVRTAIGEVIGGVRNNAATFGTVTLVAANIPLITPSLSVTREPDFLNVWSAEGENQTAGIGDYLSASPSTDGSSSPLLYRHAAETPSPFEMVALANPITQGNIGFSLSDVGQLNPTAAQVSLSPASRAPSMVLMQYIVCLKGRNPAA